MPQRVPPRARAASFSPAGHWAKTSRTTEAMIGRHISATTRPAMKNDRKRSAPGCTERNGTQPKCFVIQPDSEPTRGASTMTPQMP